MKFITTFATLMTINSAFASTITCSFHEQPIMDAQWDQKTKVLTYTDTQSGDEKIVKNVVFKKVGIEYLPGLKSAWFNKYAFVLKKDAKKAIKNKKLRLATLVLNYKGEDGGREAFYPFSAKFFDGSVGGCETQETKAIDTVDFDEE